MENLVWTEHTRGHWEADHCGMCLHVFKSLNGSCWSVYDQVIEIDGRGAMMPFEKAQASAVAAAERWSGNARLASERDGYLETIRETFRVLESCGQAPDDNAPLSVNVRRVLDYLDRVTAERDLHERRAEHFQAEVQRVMQESWTNITELAALKADNDAHIATWDKVRATLGCEPHEGVSDAAKRVVSERDAALAELAEVKKNMLRFSADGMRITRENTKADALELALSLIAERDAAVVELAALKESIAACFKCHADACGGGKYSCLDFAVEQENLKPGWYALYPVPTPEGKEEFDA